MFGKKKDGATMGDMNTGVGAGATAVAEATPKESKPSKVNRERLDQFYELKNRIHRKLVEQLDMTSLSEDSEELRKEVREVVTSLAEEENALLNFQERQRLITEVLDETLRTEQASHLAGCRGSPAAGFGELKIRAVLERERSGDDKAVMSNGMHSALDGIQGLAGEGVTPERTIGEDPIVASVVEDSAFPSWAAFGFVSVGV